MNDTVTAVATLRKWRKQICKEDGSFVIWGHIYDDALNRFPDGHFIHTSLVIRIEDDMAFTRNNVYRLEGESVGPDIGYT